MWWFRSTPGKGHSPHVIQELVIRFLAGGVLVCAFAVLGDKFKPRSFGGLFGAAPSVALSTLTLEIVRQGSQYASREARTMWAGALAFAFYAFLVSWALMRFRRSALVTTAAAIPAWFAVAFALWAFFLR
jgi:hypothetical protein